MARLQVALRSGGATSLWVLDGEDAVHQDSLQDTKSYSESGTLMMGGEKDDLFSEARLLHF